MTDQPSTAVDKISVAPMIRQYGDEFGHPGFGAADFEGCVWTLLGLHKNGALSEPGLVEAIVTLAVQLGSGDGAEVTAARRSVLAGTDGGQR